MHIVLANQWFPPESGWGGVAMYNYTMAHAYRSLGHEVTVIASRLDSNIPMLSETGGIRVLRLLTRDAYHLRRLPGPGCYVRSIQQLAYAWRVNQSIRAVHADEPVDVVEFAEANAEGFLYARNPQTPLVVRCHTPTSILRRHYTCREVPYDTRITEWCEKDLIRRATSLTAPSSDMAQVIARECNVPIENITVIPNALCLDAFSTTIARAPSNEITILHVGRLERVKGVGVLAEAIPRVIHEIPNARFVFAGGDRPTASGASQRSELEMKLANARALSHVELLGAVNQMALLDLYRRADICVVPSMLYESFSYTCAQAMAAGKPVIASRIGGIPETVDDGVNGILLTPGDVGELAQAIVRLARDSTLREEMGRCGRAKVIREFDAKKIARRNLEIYESLL